MLVMLTCDYEVTQTVMLMIFSTLGHSNALCSCNKAFGNVKISVLCCRLFPATKLAVQKPILIFAVYFQCFPISNFFSTCRLKNHCNKFLVTYLWAGIKSSILCLICFTMMYTACPHSWLASSLKRAVIRIYVGALCCWVRSWDRWSRHKLISKCISDVQKKRFCGRALACSMACCCWGLPSCRTDHRTDGNSGETETGELRWWQ